MILPLVALVAFAGAVVVALRPPATTRGRVLAAVAVGAAAGLGAAALGTGLVELARGSSLPLWLPPAGIGLLLLGATVLAVRGLRRAEAPSGTAPAGDPGSNGHRTGPATAEGSGRILGRVWGVVATVLALVPAPFWLADDIALPDISRPVAVALAVMPVIACLLPAMSPTRHRKAAIYLGTFLLLPFAFGFVFLYGPPFLVLLAGAIVQYRRSARPVR